MRKFFIRKKKTPIGIYDAKTELFYWEPIRRQKFDRITVQELGKFGNEIIAMAQTLRSQDSPWVTNKTPLQSDMLQRPVFMTDLRVEREKSIRFRTAFGVGWLKKHKILSPACLLYLVH